LGVVFFGIDFSIRVGFEKRVNLRECPEGWQALKSKTQLIDHNAIHCLMTNSAKMIHGRWIISMVCNRVARRRLKTLRGLTPYEYICKIWTSEPDRFIVNPIHQMLGLNT